MNDSQLKSARYRIAAVLFVARSFFSASTIAAFTLTTIIAVALTGDEKMAGIPNTMTTIGRALFAYPLGLMMDKYGRRLALSTGFFFAAFGLLLSIFAVINANFWLFLGGAMMIGMARSASDQSRYVAAEVFPSNQRAKVIGLLVFAGTIGSIGGPALVGPSATFVESLGYPREIGPFVVAFIAMLISLIVIVLLLFPDPRELGKQVAEMEAAEDVDSVENLGESRALGTIFAAPLVQIALASMIFGYFVMSFVMIITPLHMNKNAHTLEATAFVLSMHTMGMFGLSFITGGLIDRFGRIPIIRVGAIILIISCVIAPTSTSLPVLSTALFLLGLGWNFTFVGGSSLLSDALASHERGRGQGASEMLIAICAGLASVSTGLVFSAGGYILVAIVGFTFSIILLVLSFILYNRVKKQEINAAVNSPKVA